MWSGVTSYIWKHNETLVFHSSFAPSVVLGSLSDSMALISVAPLEFLPSVQLGLVCLNQIKDTCSLEFYQFIKDFTFSSWLLGCYLQWILEFSFVRWCGRFRMVKDITVTRSMSWKYTYPSVPSAFWDFRGHCDLLFLIGEVSSGAVKCAEGKIPFPWVVSSLDLFLSSHPKILALPPSPCRHIVSSRWQPNFITSPSKTWWKPLSFKGKKIMVYS